LNYQEFSDKVYEVQATLFLDSERIFSGESLGLVAVIVLQF